MQDDLFQKPLTVKEKLLRYIKSVHYAPTSAIQRWGCDNYTNRADRTARELAESGNIRRMAEDEKLVSRFARSREDVWVYCHD